MASKPAEISPSFFLKSNSWEYGQRVIIKARIVGFGRRVKNVPKYLIIKEIVEDTNRQPRIEYVNFGKPSNYDMLRNYMYAKNTLLRTLKEYYIALGWEKFTIEESGERLTTSAFTSS